MLLPPEVEPLTLDHALSALAKVPTRFREAMWTLARSVPPARLGPRGSHRGTIDRYPRELLELLDQGKVKDITGSGKYGGHCAYRISGA